MISSLKLNQLSPEKAFKILMKNTVNKGVSVRLVVTRPLLTRPEVTCYLHIVPVTHYLGIRLEVDSLY